MSQLSAEAENKVVLNQAMMQKLFPSGPSPNLCTNKGMLSDQYINRLDSEKDEGAVERAIKGAMYNLYDTQKGIYLPLLQEPKQALTALANNQIYRNFQNFNKHSEF